MEAEDSIVGYQRSVFRDIAEPYERFPKSNLLARKSDSKYYFTGKSCQRNHIAPRRTGSGNCCACENLRSPILYNANKIQHNFLMRRWRKNNKARSLEYVRAWRSKHPHKIAAAQARKRAKQKQASPPWVNFKEIQEIYLACRRVSLDVGFECHVDHIVPLNHPFVCGLHVPWNLRIVDAQTNLAKGNKLECQAT